MAIKPHSKKNVAEGLFAGLVATMQGQHGRKDPRKSVGRILFVFWFMHNTVGKLLMDKQTREVLEATLLHGVDSGWLGYVGRVGLLGAEAGILGGTSSRVEGIFRCKT